MTIRYKPKKLLALRMPKKTVEKLVTNRLSLNRAALTTLDRIGVLKKKTLERTALKVIRNYKRKFKTERAVSTVGEALDETLNSKKLMVQRVQNEAVREISSEIRDQYSGEFYIWTESSAVVPDELHILKYGEIFQIGKGEMPGERYGCRCGMDILVDQKNLEL